MTTELELEQEFFDTFGIEPVSKWHKCKDYSCVCCDEYDNCSKREFIYPEITDHRLLKMICILNNYGKYDCWGVTVTRLKDAILENCIAVVVSKLLNDVILEQFKHQIQQLFKGEHDN